jgi:hypothetical protein
MSQLLNIDNNFLKAVWDGVVADRDVLRAALVSVQDVLSIGTTDNLFVEGSPFPLLVLDARLTVATTRPSFLAARTTALFETTTTPALTS